MFIRLPFIRCVCGLAASLVLIGPIAGVGAKADHPSKAETGASLATGESSADDAAGLTPEHDAAGLPITSRGEPSAVLVPPRLQLSTASFDRHVTAFLEELGGLGQNYWVQLTFPVRFTWQHPGRALIGAAGIGALIVTDHLTYRVADASSGLDRPAARLSDWGQQKSAYPLVLTMAAVGVFANSPRERETSLLLTEALLTSGTWTYLIKGWAGRERPKERQEQVADWGVGLRSFPSGHSTGAWAVATVIANQYSGHRAVPIVAYGTAAAMSYSRMVVGAHWLSDVVVGGLIGYGCAKQVIAAHRARYGDEDDGERGVGVQVDVTGEYKGVSLKFDF